MIQCARAGADQAGRGLSMRVTGMLNPADIPTGERAVRRELLHPLRDFLSVGHFAVHERKFSRYFKGIF
jgi:hypothetical protein